MHAFRRDMVNAAIVFGDSHLPAPIGSVLVLISLSVCKPAVPGVNASYASCFVLNSRI